MFLPWLLACSGSGSPSATGDTRDTGTAVSRTCDQIRADWKVRYEAVVADDTCIVAVDCHAPYGACATGLGGCQEAVNVAVTQDDIDAVAAQFSAEAEAAGCEPTTAACDCYGGYRAACESGHCVLTGPYY